MDEKRSTTVMSNPYCLMYCSGLFYFIHVDAWEKQVYVLAGSKCPSQYFNCVEKSTLNTEVRQKNGKEIKQRDFKLINVFFVLFKRNTIKALVGIL